MSITDPNNNRNQYTASATETTFAFNYRIFADGDLNVYYTPPGQSPNPTNDIITLSTDYTVQQNANPNLGGNIILTVGSYPTGAAAGAIITIERSIAFDRNTDYSQGGEFTAVSFNTSFEKSRAIEQQIRGLLEQRGLTYKVTDILDPSGSPTRDTTIPALGANEFWAMNAAQTEIVTADLTEAAGCSTLRSELASETAGSDGADLVGYWDGAVGKTVKDALDGFSAGAAPFSDSSALVKNNADNTKLMRIDNANLPTATTIVMETPRVGGMLGYPPYYTQGFQLSNDAGDTAHDISIGIGVARKGDSNDIFVTSAALVKQIDAVWAEGTGLGGRASAVSLSPSTWYHVFVIVKSDGTVDAGFDTTLNAANLLVDTTGSGYTEFMRVGSVLTDGSSNILPFIQTDNSIIWNTPVQNYQILSNPGTAAITVTAQTPVGVKTKVIGGGQLKENSSNTNALYISDLDTPDIPATSSVVYTFGLEDTSSPKLASGVFNVITNTSSQYRIRVKSSSGGTSITFNTLGYEDRINKP